MISVILTVLKIIGLILLAILGLILFILLCILLVPVRYEGDASYLDKPFALARVTWFFKLLRIEAGYSGKVIYSVKVLFFTILTSDKKKKKGRKRKKKSSDSSEGRKKAAKSEGNAKSEGKTDEDFDDELFEELLEEAEEAQESQANAKAEELEKAEKKNREKLDEVHKDTENSRKRKQKKTKKDKPGASEPEETKPEETKPEAIKCEADDLSEEKSIDDILEEKLEAAENKVYELIDKKDEIFEKLDDLIDKKDKAFGYIEDEKNIKSFKRILKRVIIILKHVIPKKLTGRVKFGLDDGYTMGKILTYVSFLYPLYAKDFSLEPYFEKVKPVAEIKFKGRIRLGTLAFNALILLADGNIRKQLFNKLLHKGGKDGR